MNKDLPLVLLGMPVRVVPSRPKLEITPSFPYCSEAFRREWNAWALERFGLVDDVIIFGAGALRMVAVPEHLYPTLRNEIARLPLFKEPRSVVQLRNVT